MEYVRFGKSNLKVSRLAMGAMGFGTPDWREWVLNDTDSRAIVKKSLDCGINFFDTCDFYSIGESEAILGRALLEYVPRDEVIVATKVGNPMAPHPNARGFSRKHIFDGVDASLKRLQTNYIDLYQTHVWDPETELEELVDAFADVVRSGKVRYVGVTTLPAWSFSKILHIAETKQTPPFVSMQCEYNLCHREAERELIPLCRAEGVALIPFSPFARGFLCADRRQAENVTSRTTSDTYTHNYYYRDGDFAVYETVANIAKKRNLTAAQVALAWVLRQPGITAPIFGATQLNHIDDAVAALDISLDNDEIIALEDAYQPRTPRRSGH
jgi:aryl-alcohol dehydrogenase-like predicted oxidoreductase